MKTYRVKKMGPYGVRDTAGVLVYDGTKAEMLAAARRLADADVVNGDDVRIEVVDEKGRPLKTQVFYADDYKDADDRAKQEAQTAAKKAVA